jgi:hypothetical protein
MDLDCNNKNDSDYYNDASEGQDEDDDDKVAPGETDAPTDYTDFH